jgi:hypothetical protein
MEPKIKEPEAGAWCPECGGFGTVLAHASDCHDDFCALVGGYNDCQGRVMDCPTCDARMHSARQALENPHG